MSRELVTDTCFWLTLPERWDPDMLEQVQVVYVVIPGSPSQPEKDDSPLPPLPSSWCLSQTGSPPSPWLRRGSQHRLISHNSRRVVTCTWWISTSQSCWYKHYMTSSSHADVFLFHWLLCDSLVSHNIDMLWHAPQQTRYDDAALWRHGHVLTYFHCIGCYNYDRLVRHNIDMLWHASQQNQTCWFSIMTSWSRVDLFSLHWLLHDDNIIDWYACK